MLALIASNDVDKVINRSRRDFKLEKGQLVLSQDQGYSKLRIDIKLHTQPSDITKGNWKLVLFYYKNGKWYFFFTDKPETKPLPKTVKLDFFCSTSDNEKHLITKSINQISEKS